MIYARTIVADVALIMD